MNAIQELGEVVKVVDKGERVLAFAAWLSKWVDQGHVESYFPVRRAKEADATGAGGPAARAEDDRNTLAAFMRILVGQKPLPELVELEDLGVQEIDGEPAYVSRIKITILRAVPHGLAAPVPPAAGFLS